MATQSFSYDHPAYTTPRAHGGETTAGNGTLSNRFAAWAALIAKSAQLVPITAGTTAGHTVTINKISGTTTTSLAVATLGTDAAGINPQNITLGDTALAQGDELVCQNGTDATGVAAVTYEYLVQPRTTVTQ